MSNVTDTIVETEEDGDIFRFINRNLCYRKDTRGMSLAEYLYDYATDLLEDGMEFHVESCKVWKL